MMADNDKNKENKDVSKNNNKVDTEKEQKDGEEKVEEEGQERGEEEGEGEPTSPELAVITRVNQLTCVGISREWLPKLEVKV